MRERGVAGGAVEGPRGSVPEMGRTAASVAGPRPRVVVGNPGSIPEMTRMAAGLARAGMLRRCVLPFSDSMGGAVAFARRLPGAAGRTARRDLARRALPAEIALGGVRHEATWAEAAYIASVRLGMPGTVRDRLLWRRNHVFDRRLASVVRRGDAGVVVTYGAALATLGRARALGVRSYLQYPGAHHRFVARILREEAAEGNADAGMDGFRFSPGQTMRLDAELAATDRIFVLSSFAARTMIEAGVDREKLILTPLGVDLELFRPGCRGEDGVFRVLFAGNIAAHKGVRYLCEAVQLAGLPDVELQLVGQAAAGAGRWLAGQNVRHVPHRSRSELPAAYAAADVLVLPSLVDAFGLAALEAMACGLPVIVSEHTFGADVITDGVEGYVIPIRDAPAIAERLRHLHDHPAERRRMGSAARRRAEEFSWERYGERVVGYLTP